MSNDQDVRWWDEPERLDDAELQSLVRAAESVLSRKGDADQSAGELSRMPRSVLAKELREAVGEEGLVLDADAAGKLVEGALARESALAVLRELGREPDVRTAIDDAYRASDELLFVDPGTLAVAALVLLVVKVRRVRVGKEGVDIRFDSIKEGVIARIVELVGL